MRNLICENNHGSTCRKEIKRASLADLDLYCFHIMTCMYPSSLVLVFMSQSTNFQSCLEGSSWVKPVLSRGKRILLSASHEDRTRNPSIKGQALYHRASHYLGSRTSYFLLVRFDSLRPINNLSVKQGRVFLG